MAKLTEEEIELWYEEQKQKLSERYIACINKGMILEHRAKKFDKAMKKLNAQYDMKHTRLMQQKVSEENSKKRRQVWLRPIFWIGHVFLVMLMFIGRGFASLFKTKYANAKFKASLAWIHNGYRVTDSTRTAFRPSYYFYVKHLKPPLLVITRPFARFGKRMKKKTEQTKYSIKNAAAAVWKYTKISVKWIVKHSTSVYKWAASKQEGYSKIYHAWYAKRVQDALDKKQKNKEEKEARRKAKLGVTNETPKEGEAVPVPAEAPDAENAS